MVAWLNPNLIRAVWHPGTTEPGGGSWPGRTYLAGSDRTNLVAAFNSAFRLSDARGGFYDNGRTLSHLRTGAASLVVDRQGHIDVGAWGSEVTMQPTTAVVRQNLALLVDNGQVAAGIGSNAGHRWGATVGNSYYVWRSGIGVTASGAVVLVEGNRSRRRPSPTCCSGPARSARWSWTSTVTGPRSSSTAPPTAP